jgi:hypothetical protein
MHVALPGVSPVRKDNNHGYRAMPLAVLRIVATHNAHAED